MESLPTVFQSENLAHKKVFAHLRSISGGASSALLPPTNPNSEAAGRSAGVASAGWPTLMAPRSPVAPPPAAAAGLSALKLKLAGSYGSGCTHATCATSLTIALSSKVTSVATVGTLLGFVRLICHSTPACSKSMRIRESTARPLAALPRRATSSAR